MKYIILALSIVTMFSACKEDEHIKPATATITVINAITDVPNVKVNATGNSISWKNTTEQVAYGARGFYYAATGLVNLTAVASADTTKMVFNGSFNLQSKVYSMYLTGTVAQADTLFREETTYPYIRTDVVRPASTDSIVNVRFVNLSVGSPALKVKLATGTSNEVDNLPYKGIGNWKAYPAKLASTVYSFQIRRVDNDALLTTFSFTANATNRFKNVTLVIRGVFGTTTGTAPFGVTAINYF